jgi:hypothetical protein
MTTTERRVDHSAIRVNQVLTIALLILAFVLDSALLAGLVAVIMLVSAAAPRLGLFRMIYERLLKPAGLVKPDVLIDNPEPHRFAQAVGGTLVAVGAVAVASGLAAFGWALVWLVVFLASANLFLGFCAGCFVYYQLNRLGIPGFGRSPMRRT